MASRRPDGSRSTTSVAGMDPLRRIVRNHESLNKRGPAAASGTGPFESAIGRLDRESGSGIRNPESGIATMTNLRTGSLESGFDQDLLADWNIEEPDSLDASSTLSVRIDRAHEVLRVDLRVGRPPAPRKTCFGWKPGHVPRLQFCGQSRPEDSTGWRSCRRGHGRMASDKGRVLAATETVRNRRSGLVRGSGPPPAGREPGRPPATGRRAGGLPDPPGAGRARFARVYLAEEIHLGGRLVAIKVSRPEGDEPQVLARLQHTHIVPVHSVCDDPETGLRVLCMPYFGGANLAQVLDAAGGLDQTEHTAAAWSRPSTTSASACPDRTAEFRLVRGRASTAIGRP